MTGREHRGTIFVEDAEVRGHQEFPGRQYVIRLHAPRCAAAAVPGSFAHLSCDAELPMRRPLSIMLADAAAGTIDILYKVVGPGLEKLSRQRVGTRLSLMGPIGRGFTASSDRPRSLLIGGGVGIPPMIFLADALRRPHRRTLAAAGAHGFRDPVSVPCAAIHAADPGNACRGDRRYAAARGLGRAEPAREPGRVSRLLRGLRDGARRGVARDARAASARRRPRSMPAARRRCSRRWRDSRAATASPPRSRSRSSWPARSAAAPAARCRS